MPSETARVRVGPAGWSYADWNGIVYPKPMPRGVDRLEWIARWFDVVEINSTYYHPAALATVESWVRRTSDFPRFNFTVKLLKRFTHERTSAWTRAEATEVRDALELMRDGGKLGAVLAQFPWSFRRDDDNRIWLGDVIAAFGEFPLVVELRHESWNVPSLYESLAESGVGFVNIDQPQFRHSIKPSADGDVGSGLCARAWKELQELVSQGRRRGGALRLHVQRRRAEAVGRAREGDSRGNARGVRDHEQSLPRPGAGERGDVEGDDNRGEDGSAGEVVRYVSGSVGAVCGAGWVVVGRGFCRAAVRIAPPPFELRRRR